MATRIRLKRIGRKNRPFYRVVVMDSRQRRDGAAIEELGWYNPIAKEKDGNYKLNEERLLHWLKMGAQPSDIAHKLMQRAGIAMKWHLMKQGLDEKAIEKEIQKLALRREAQAKEKIETAEKDTKKKVKETEEVKAATDVPSEEKVEAPKTDEPVVEAVALEDVKEKVEEAKVEDADKVKEEVKEEPKVEETAEENSETEVKAEKETEVEQDVKSEEAIEAKTDDIEKKAEKKAEKKDDVAEKKSTPKKKTESKPSAKKAESKDKAEDDK